MKIKILIFSSLLFLAFSCRNTETKNLAEVEKQELAKGIRNDSLFQGLYLGMPKPDFFEYCWGMNKKKIFHEGSSKTVEYDVPDKEPTYPLLMNFYPTFTNDKMSEMPVRFTYKRQDIFNKNMQTEHLFKDVKKLMERWYGAGFFISPLAATGGKGYVKVEGNRRIMIFVEKDFEVMVVFTDLSVAK